MQSKMEEIIQVSMLQERNEKNIDDAVFIYLAYIEFLLKEAPYFSKNNRS